MPNSSKLKQAQAAKAMGVSASRLSQLSKDDPAAFGRENWTKAGVAGMKAELAARRENANRTKNERYEEDAADPDRAIKALAANPEKAARIRLLIERTAKLKLERELLAGGHVRKEDVDKMLQSRVFSVRAKLQELPLRASLIAGRTEAECERMLTDWAREVCDYYANGGN